MQPRGTLLVAEPKAVTLGTRTPALATGA